MSSSAVSVRGLTKTYRLGEYTALQGSLRDAVSDWLRPHRGPRQTIQALDDVSFEVEPGQVLGIVGRNGAGKTTLLKILSRITKPTSGEARVWGRVGSLLEVGTGFHPDLTGRENVYLNGAILGMKRSEIDRRFDEIVAFAEVERFLDTPVKRYSSGMYLRLAFAVAAHLEPEILVVDEVLAVGDASFQRKCLGKMGEVSGEGRTVLLVSHNMAAVTSLATSCIWLDAGRIRELGRPPDVVAAYLSSDLAAGQPGYADLSDAALRIGVSKRTEGELRFDWVRLLEREGAVSGVFFEDEPLRIELGLQASVPAEAVEVLVKVLTIEGQLVFTLTSGVQELPVRPGALETSVVVPRLPLRPGRYLLDLYALTRLPQDYVAGPIGFEVVGSREGVDDPRFTRDDWSLGPIRVDQEWAPIRGGSSRFPPRAPLPVATRVSRGEPPAE
jgi:lipopolysaccharide transport system ATP-binding protein